MSATSHASVATRTQSAMDAVSVLVLWARAHPEPGHASWTAARRAQIATAVTRLEMYDGADAGAHEGLRLGGVDVRLIQEMKTHAIPEVAEAVDSLLLKWTADRECALLAKPPTRVAYSQLTTMTTDKPYRRPGISPPPRASAEALATGRKRVRGGDGDSGRSTVPARRSTKRVRLGAVPWRDKVSRAGGPRRRVTKCIYFASPAGCRNPACTFSHEAVTMPLCNFFLMGMCTKGRFCSYAHPRSCEHIDVPLSVANHDSFAVRIWSLRQTHAGVDIRAAPVQPQQRVAETWVRPGLVEAEATESSSGDPSIYAEAAAAAREKTATRGRRFAGSSSPHAPSADLHNDALRSRDFANGRGEFFFYVPLHFTRILLTV